MPGIFTRLSISLNKVAEYWKSISKQGKKEPIAIAATLIAMVAAFFTMTNAISNVGNYLRSVKMDEKNIETNAVSQLLADLQTAEMNACAARSSPSGSHTFKLALERAAALESQYRSSVPVQAYHALADLGNEYWDFSRIKEFCDLAITKSRTELDRQLSYQQLGCSHFDAYETSKESLATLQDARSNFEKATTLLRKSSLEKRAAKLLGQAYELWAAHETYHQNVSAADEAARQAKNAWKDLPPHEQLEMTTALEAHLADAERGIHPKSPCRTNSKSPPVIKSDYTINVPQLSKDKSLGEVIDGKLYMHLVELIPVEGTIAVPEKEKPGYYRTVRQISYVHDVQTRVFENIEDEIPLGRYIRYDNNYPVDAPALPWDKAIAEAAKAQELAKSAQSILEETIKTANNLRDGVKALNENVDKIDERIADRVGESFSSTIADMKTRAEENEQHRLRLEKLATYLHSLLPASSSGSLNDQDEKEPAKTPE